MKKPKSKDYLYLSGYFLNDCYEYLRRYNLCVGDTELFERKSWSVKHFVDLRMAYETILKAIIIYYSCREKNEEYIMEIIEKYKHNIEKLTNQVLAIEIVPEMIKEHVNKVDKKIYEIPVGLRYTFDVYDFMEAQEELFYGTLRSEGWLQEIYENISILRSTLQDELDNLPIEYTITLGSEINFEDLFKKKKSKYSSKKRN